PALHLAGHVIECIDLKLPYQAGREEVVYDRGRSREIAGSECEDRRVDRIARYRLWRSGCKSRRILGLRWYSARVGRVDYPGQRGKVFLVADRAPRDDSLVVPRRPSLNKRLD